MQNLITFIKFLTAMTVLIATLLTSFGPGKEETSNVAIKNGNGKQVIVEQCNNCSFLK